MARFTQTVVNASGVSKFISAKTAAALTEAVAAVTAETKPIFLDINNSSDANKRFNGTR